MRWLPWILVALLIASGGVGASCGRAALKASQVRADSAIAGAALDSAEAAQARKEKEIAIAQRDRARGEAVAATTEAEETRSRNLGAEAALPILPDTCQPALALVASLRTEADLQQKAAKKWRTAFVSDSIALAAAQRETEAERQRGNRLNAALIDLRRESARDPDRWILGLPRPRVVIGFGVQADPTGRATSGVQVTAGIPIF